MEIKINKINKNGKKQQKKAKSSRFQASFWQVILVKFFWFIVIVLIAGIFSIEYFGIIKPKIAMSKNGGPYDIKARESLLKEQRSYFKKIQALAVASVDIKKEDLEKLDYVLSVTPNMPIMLTQIDILTKQSGLELDGLNIGFEKGVINMDLSFKGGSHQIIKQFLDRIEKNIRVMDVTQISMMDLGDRLSITIQTYYKE